MSQWRAGEPAILSIKRSEADCTAPDPARSASTGPAAAQSTAATYSAIAVTAPSRQSRKWRLLSLRLPSVRFVPFRWRS